MKKINKVVRLLRARLHQAEKEEVRLQPTSEKTLVVWYGNKQARVLPNGKKGVVLKEIDLKYFFKNVVTFRFFIYLCFVFLRNTK